MFMFFFRGTVILFGRTSRAAMKSWISESDITLQVGEKGNINLHNQSQLKTEKWRIAEEMGIAKWVVQSSSPQSIVKH